MESELLLCFVMLCSASKPMYSLPIPTTPSLLALSSSLSTTSSSSPQIRLQMTTEPTGTFFSSSSSSLLSASSSWTSSLQKPLSSPPPPPTTPSSSSPTYSSFSKTSAPPTHFPAPPPPPPTTTPPPTTPPTTTKTTTSKTTPPLSPPPPTTPLPPPTTPTLTKSNTTPQSTATPSLSPPPTTTSSATKFVKNELDAYNYLVKFGYEVNLKPSKEVANSQDLRGAIAQLQEFAGLPPTGLLDKATLDLMNSARCQLPDITNETKHLRRMKRYNSISKWSRTTLSYSVRNFPTSSKEMQDPYKVIQAIDTAFNDWSAVSSLNFQRTSDSNSNIQLAFYKGKHGDEAAFDGPGLVLAHAFFPEVGWIHFDDEEMWSSDNRGPNLRQVATHEIGHMLGLGHSSVSNSVMFPYYWFNNNFQLQQDDINGIVSLYGTKGSKVNLPDPIFTTPAAATMTTSTTTTAPRLPATSPHPHFYTPGRPFMTTTPPFDWWVKSRFTPTRKRT